ncbi:hypothetical protein CROQUDRAFT_382054 [Cronartium quercuum f. sp. fusiforme G11]|uniref:Uncharacterized protein n=1 Tax=Cronartium quercuum f. sp. fusiforme G11 TaxID=708437 RepID=A0A9P6NA89_9BASI|nr:hypothetical protein CROQUDRAFT_382054 [Cronartium quercuum f. sp. fusiforme G11]
MSTPYNSRVVYLFLIQALILKVCQSLENVHIPLTEGIWNVHQDITKDFTKLDNGGGDEALKTSKSDSTPRSGQDESTTNPLHLGHSSSKAPLKESSSFIEQNDQSTGLSFYSIHSPGTLDVFQQAGFQLTPYHGASTMNAVDGAAHSSATSELWDKQSWQWQDTNGFPIHYPEEVVVPSQTTQMDYTASAHEHKGTANHENGLNIAVDDHSGLGPHTDNEQLNSAISTSTPVARKDPLAEIITAIRKKIGKRKGKPKISLISNELPMTYEIHGPSDQHSEEGLNTNADKVDKSSKSKYRVESFFFLMFKPPNLSIH